MKKYSLIVFFVFLYIFSLQYIDAGENRNNSTEQMDNAILFRAARCTRKSLKHNGITDFPRALIDLNNVIIVVSNKEDEELVVDVETRN